MKGDEVEGLVAVQRGSRGDTQEGKEGAGKGSLLLFQKEKGKRTFSQSSVPGRRDALSKLFSSLSFSKLASFFTSQNSMAMDLMQKYPALNLVAPTDSAADLAVNTKNVLHPLSHRTFSLVNSFIFMNIQLQSSPHFRTSLSPSLLSQVVHPSSATSATSGFLSPLSLPAPSSSTSFSFNYYRIQLQALSFIPIQKHR
ncbi:uncharacterized protein MONOS_13899 [Monocercomonoides exilis]|uniref:uncharacterized protein n=1 Tax=Monocercomonoides exilis TaxID=2049356 RepID=UPI00355AAAC7|nr:hypothetical protein MONOS_13899 [Monocercomonoides exilis]|eukprot:MONOS_13899.1-p1 / transcript=MONOS_13899.1 / gene=MONOS_13899 / organism=Monocercomonoides_exilis_PA203 / gene_product=unspecified product / transcript_product=unspecified product / location=Mono_scaffold00901:12252-12845(-) / protein_length=198 / sequence_SO=supercontig / SO=protein_coding / is_pseudo=false